MDAWNAVNDFLTSRCGTGLEEVLCDGCLVGRVGLAAADQAKVIPRLVASLPEADGGVSETYEGMLIVDGIWYRFRVEAFIDAGGLKFLSNVDSFDAVQWEVRLAM